MLNDARLHLFDSPHLVLFPALAVAGAVLGFNFLGDRYAISSTRGRVWKWDCEAIMVMLKKAMVSTAGGFIATRSGTAALATLHTPIAMTAECGHVNYSSEGVAEFPDPSGKYQEIDSQWEPLLSHCECGGTFSKAPLRAVPIAISHLSATHAASHMEKKQLALPRAGAGKETGTAYIVWRSRTPATRALCGR